MKILRRSALVSVAAALLLSACVSSEPAQYQSTSNSRQASNGDLHQSLNAERAARGLGSVRADATLARAAVAHALDMAQKNYFSHYEPDGGTPVTRVKEAGGCRASVSENIAMKWNNDMKVFWAWMGSPGHYKNMMGKKYTRYGMGEYGGYYVMVLAGPCV